MSSHETPKTKSRRKRKAGFLFWLIPLLCILIAGGFLFQKYYLIAGGSIISRGSTELDLREKKLSAEQYDAICAELPDCAIRWNVPLGDSSFDSESRAVAVSGFTGADLGNLAYFSDLQELDVRTSVLSEEEYKMLTAAVPPCHVLWSVPIGAERFPSDAESIVLDDFSESDISRFAYFEALQLVDARGSNSYDAILALREARSELEILWQVPVSGTVYPQDAEELQIDSTATSSTQLTEALGRLPAVTKISVPECTYTTEEKLGLLAQFPEVQFQWPMTVAGQTFTGTETEISLAGRSFSAADYDTLLRELSAFPQLETIDLTGCSLTDEQVFALCRAYPAVDFIWDFTLYDVAINTLDTEVDFSNIPMESTDAVEALIPCMHHLEKVVMCDCGFSNEEMDALNKKYEDVKFVWMLHISAYSIRTDAIGFRGTSKHYGVFTAETIQELGYCTDMITLDLGHRMPEDLTFLYQMPNIKHLVLLDSRTADLTPVGSLQEMVWLELNRAETDSIAPLINCAGLRDLNITFMFGKVKDGTDIFDTLMQMPQLERVWFDDTELTYEQQAALEEKYPDIVYHRVWDWDQSNEDPWRFDQDYYDMRDNLGMFYMCGTGYINYKIIDGVRYELDPVFLANQDLGKHDRDR